MSPTIAVAVKAVMITLSIVVVQAQLTTDPNLIQQQIVFNVQDTLNTTPPDEVALLRYDQLTDLLVETAKTDAILSQDEATQIDYVVRGISVSIITSFWNDVLFDPNNSQSQSWDERMSLFVSSLLGVTPEEEAYPNFLEIHQDILNLLQERGNLFFTNRITAAYEQVQELYYKDVEGETSDVVIPPLPAPVYQVTYGYEHATNAKMYGFIPTDMGLVGEGRCVLMFNLGAIRMLTPDYFQIAATHETWHCYQFALHHVDVENLLVESDNDDNNDESENDLLKFSMREGIATYLTSLSTSINEENTNGGKFETQDLLFWSTEEYDAASTLKRDILLEFSNVRHVTTDQSVFQEWLVLNIPLRNVDGAPSRCAYYVAYLAIQAYVEEMAQEGVELSPRELLDLTETSNGREMIWQALVKKETLDDTDAGGDGAGGGNGGGGNDDGDSLASAAFNVSSSVWMSWMFLHVAVSVFG